MSRKRLLAAALIAPLLLLIALSFLLPLGTTLYRAIDNSELQSALPQTSALLRAWDGSGSPPDAIYPIMVEELRLAHESQNIGKLLRRLNFEQPGLRSMLLKLVNNPTEIAAIDRHWLIAQDKRWAGSDIWQLLKRASDSWTPLYFLRSLDLRTTPDGSLGRVDASEAVYVSLFIRTFQISAIVTLICALIAYPVAFTLTILPQRLANIGMMLVLVPFWTSILVRTTAWFIILQREGPINALLLSIGLIDNPLTMIFTRFAVYLAMVHVLLPFAILPIYSVMKGIKPDYMRAAASLGAPGWRRFLRIYLPLSMPGVAAGSVIVFMLSVGFYITPALVGGTNDQMISYFIAFFTNTTVNWGMAAALASILLLMTGVLVVLTRLLLPGVRTAGPRA